MPTFQAIANKKDADKIMSQYERSRRGKKERPQPVRAVLGDRRFNAFRPYHVRRHGVPVITEYTFWHCRKSSMAADAIEDFFHSAKMRSRGYYKGFSGAWKLPYKPAAHAVEVDPVG